MSAISDDLLAAATAGAIAVAIVLAFLMRAGREKIVAWAQIVFLLLALALLALAYVRQPWQSGGARETRPEWHVVGKGITEGISGLAFVGVRENATIFIAVHDNKEPGQKRVSAIERRADGQVQTRPLNWTTGPMPIDLEAVCRLPGDAPTFLALTSRGALYRFTYGGGDSELAIDGIAAGVPNAAEERQFQSFDVQQVGGQTFACWAERGSSDAPGVIFCSTFDAATVTFGEPQSLEVRAPWPERDTRHVGDLRILTDGTIIAASASDPGNDGPFASAIYIAATLQPAGERPQIIPAQPITRLLTTSTHKIEALELVPGARGGLVIGSDDENAGAALLFAW